MSEIWRLASWVSLGKTSAKHRKLLKCSLKDHKSVGSCVYLPCASWCFLRSLAVAMWILFRELQAPFVHAFDLAFAWHSNCISTKIMRNLSCQCIDRFWAKPEAFRRIVKNSEAQKSRHKNVYTLSMTIFITNGRETIQYSCATAGMPRLKTIQTPEKTTFCASAAYLTGAENSEQIHALGVAGICFSKVFASFEHMGTSMQLLNTLLITAVSFSCFPAIS